MSDAFLHHLIRQELPEPAVNQWLGVVVDGRYLAISVPHVAAVFRNLSAPQSSGSKVIDVAVHAGAPVFIAKLSTVFEAIKDADNHADEFSGHWVVVLSNPIDTQVGFRADQVKGPFHAIAREGQVSYEGLLWQVLDTKRITHA
jgi:hypothetical protein